MLRGARRPPLPHQRGAFEKEMSTTSVEEKEMSTTSERERRGHVSQEAGERGGLTKALPAIRMTRDPVGEGSTH